MKNVLIRFRGRLASQFVGVLGQAANSFAGSVESVERTRGAAILSALEVSRTGVEVQIAANTEQQPNKVFSETISDRGEPSECSTS